MKNKLKHDWFRSDFVCLLQEHLDTDRWMIQIVIDNLLCFFSQYISIHSVSINLNSIGLEELFSFFGIYIV